MPYRTSPFTEFMRSSFSPFSRDPAGVLLFDAAPGIDPPGIAPPEGEAPSPARVKTTIFFHDGSFWKNAVKIPLTVSAGNTEAASK